MRRSLEAGGEGEGGGASPPVLRGQCRSPLWLPWQQETLKGKEKQMRRERRRKTPLSAERVTPHRPQHTHTIDRPTDSCARECDAGVRSCCLFISSLLPVVTLWPRQPPLFSHSRLLLLLLLVLLLVHLLSLSHLIHTHTHSLSLHPFDSFILSSVSLSLSLLLIADDCC